MVSNPVYLFEDVTVCQSVVRRHLASKVRSTLSHERDMTAATVIQTSWMAFIEFKRYNCFRAAAILIQTIVRMKLANDYRLSLISKLKAAATYHANDYFDYSKRRKVSTIKIQTFCRKYLATTRFIALLQRRELASIKIQSSFRMHSARNDYSVSKMITDIALVRIQSNYRKYSTQKIIWPKFEEFSRERRPAAIKIQSLYRRYMARVAYVAMKFIKDNPVSLQDFKKSYGSSRNRHVAATKIQSLYRAYLARLNYLDLFALRGTLSCDLEQTLFYSTNAFFQNSKQRRAAANTIQTAYRKHLFRTTCQFRLPSFDDDSSIDSTVADLCIERVTSPNLATASPLGQAFDHILEAFNDVITETIDVDVGRWLPLYFEDSKLKLS